MVEKFIRNKILEKLQSFIEFESTSFQDLSLSNVRIKEKVLQELSVLMHLPLSLVSGTVQTIKINKAWDKIFSKNKDDPLIIEVKGLKVVAKLSTQIQRSYLHACHKQKIHDFMKKLNKRIEKEENTFISKLREYFFGAIAIHIKDAKLEIFTHLKYEITVSLGVERFEFRKVDKNQNSRLEVHQLSLSYKVAKQSKEQYLISDVQAVFENQQESLQSTKKLNLQNCNISFNNENFNDILRIISLIKWHNSFLDVPQCLWQYKPNLLTKIPAKIKFRYMCELINYRIRQKINFKKTLQQRREYIKLYTACLKEPTNMKLMYNLQQVEQTIEVWRAQEYRKFCWLLEKQKTRLDKRTQEIRKPADEIGWFHSFFRSKEQQKIFNEFEHELESIIVDVVQSTFTLNIEEIRIMINIRSNAGNEPFLNLLSTNNVLFINLRATDNSILAKNAEIKYRSFKRISIQRLRVEFHRYNGHSPQHAFLLHQSHCEKKSGEDEFEDIQNFFEWQISEQLSTIKVEPLTLKFNEEIIQKISVFRFQRQYSDMKTTQSLILQDSYNINSQNKQEQFKPISMTCSLQIQIPSSMYEFPCEYLSLTLKQIIYTSNCKQKCLHINKINLDSFLHIAKQQQMITSQSLLDEQLLEYQNMQILNTGINVNMQTHQSLDWFVFEMQPLQIAFVRAKHLCKIINFLAKLTPKQKTVRPINKYKAMKKKQSIGEQFIDACENLNEHIVKVSLTQRTKQQKYIVKQRKNMTICIKAQGLKFALDQQIIQMQPFFAKLFIFTASKCLISEDDKQMRVQIHNVKKLLSNIKIIQEQFKKVKQQPKKESFSVSEQLELKISNLDMNISILDRKQPKVQWQVKAVEVEKKSNHDSLLVKLFTSLIFYKSVDSSRHQSQQNLKETVIEQLNIKYHQENTYNKNERVIQIDQLKINMKPVLIREIGKVLESLNTPDQIVYRVANRLIEPISLVTPQATALELRHQSEAAVMSQNCEIMFAARKEMLNLNESSIQTFRLTNKLRLIKRPINQYKFEIRSNIRCTNTQSHTLWIQIREKAQQKKGESQTNRQIFHPVLSSAHVDTLEADDIIWGKRSNSVKNEIFNNQFDSDVRSIGGDMERQSAKSGKSSRWQRSCMKMGRKFAIKPNQTLDMLIQCEEQEISISKISFGNQSISKFSGFSIGTSLHRDQQILIQSECESDQDAHILVIKTNILMEETQDFPIYDLQIMSPLIVYNQLPWNLKYRYSIQEIDVMETIKTAGKVLKKRSFQFVEIEDADPFQACRSNNVQYKDITEMEIVVGDYVKTFRLDHIIETMFADETEELNQLPMTNTKCYKNILCLNNGHKYLQIVMQLKVSKQILEMYFYPQFVFVNMTHQAIQILIREQNYSYPMLHLQPLHKNADQKQYLRLPDHKLSQQMAIKQLFQEHQSNLCTFTGSLDPETKRSAIFGDGSPLQDETIFDKSANLQNSSGLHKQKILAYGEKQIQMVVKQIKLQVYPYIDIYIFIPSLQIINKSDWTFYVKADGPTLKRLDKHEIEYVLICSKVGIQACEEAEQISFGEWMNIASNTLEMSSSNGYESREYELRKKRLKKCPKIFFRIVMTKYEYGYQMLIEESQYPPVSFINRCKSRIKITEAYEHVTEEMSNNEMAQYASKIPYHQPTFTLWMTQNYEFLKVGEFSLNEPFKSLGNKICVAIQDYKEKKIIIIQESVHPFISGLRSQLLLEQVDTFFVEISRLYFSVLSSCNKQLTCTYLKNVEISHETKYTKKSIKLKICNIQAYSYESIQPRYIFYCKELHTEKFKLFKKWIDNRSDPALDLDVVIDYHKHATILEKCKVKVSPLIVVINANTIICLIKYFYAESMGLATIIQKIRAAGMQKIRAATAKDNEDIKSVPSYQQKSFVVENFVWEQVELTFKAQNLNNFSLFIEKTSVKYLLQWVTWMGNLLPITLDPIVIKYEQYTIAKMLKLVDMNKIMNKFTKILLAYPMEEAYHIISLGAKMFGIRQGLENEFEELNTISKFIKSFFKLSKKVITLGEHSKHRQYQKYRQQFTEANRQRPISFIDKILSFKYAEVSLTLSQWKHDEEVSSRKLSIKVLRFQRYSSPLVLQPYDEMTARVQLALNSFRKDKLYREIMFVQQINYEALLGLTDEWFVLYFILKDQWVVCKPEHVLMLKQSETNKRKSKGLTIKLVGDGFDHLGLHARQYTFADNLMIADEEAQRVWQYIEGLKLSSYY